MMMRLVCPFGQRLALRAGQEAIFLFGTEPNLVDGNMVVSDDAVPAQCRMVLVGSVLLSPWEQEYAELLFLSSIPLELGRQLRLGLPHLEIINVAPAHRYHTPWQLP